MDTPVLFSQAETARLSNIPPPRFIKLVADEKIIPDFRQGKTLLFTQSSAEKIKAEFGK